MAASTNAIFPSSIDTASVTFSTANANRDGTGALATLYTMSTTGQAGPNGGAVQSITVQATSTTTAGMIRIYRNAVLIREIAVTAITPSATVKAFTIPTSEGADANGRLILNLMLKAGDILKVSTQNAEAFVASADIGLF